MTMPMSFTEQVMNPGAVPGEEMAKVQHLYEDVLLQSDTSRMAGRIRRAYAEALLNVAEERGEADDIGEQFKSLGQVFASVPQLESVFDSPALGKVRKDELILSLFGNGRASELFLNFLRLLNQKDRLGLIRLIAIAYRTLRDERGNRQRVLVETAAPLNDEQQETLRRTLAEKLNKTPILVVREKPELIGGLVVHIADKVYDTSVRTKLQTLRNQLTDRGTYAIQSGRDRFSSN
jgi:F-type H+-transporting ATPase subunit delta